MGRYINPFTDFGFKKLFGEEVNKKLLISFLNDILPIRDAAKQGEWDFKLKPVYCVGLLGFEFDNKVLISSKDE